MNRFIQLCLLAASVGLSISDGVQPIYPPAPINPTLSYAQPDSNNYPAEQPVYTPESRVSYSPYTSVQTPAASQPLANAPGDLQNYNGENYPVDGYQPYQGYEPGYGVQTGYEGYLMPSPYGQLATTESIGPLSYIYSILPYASTALAFAGKAAVLILTGAGIIIAGAVVTLLFCSFTPFCTISFHGFNPLILREEVRSLITPDNISAATKFVRDAIKKYDTFKKPSTSRRRR